MERIGRVKGCEICVLWDEEGDGSGLGMGRW